MLSQILRFGFAILKKVHQLGLRFMGWRIGLLLGSGLELGLGIIEGISELGLELGFKY